MFAPARRRLAGLDVGLILLELLLASVDQHRPKIDPRRLGVAVDVIVVVETGRFGIRLAVRLKT